MPLAIKEFTNKFIIYMIGMITVFNPAVIGYRDCTL